jgi:large subunit ribosomal protein L7/L12
VPVAGAGEWFVKEKVVGEEAREWNAAIKELGDKIVELKLIEAKELADYLKDVHGIEAAAGGAVVMAGPAGGGEEAAEPEKTSFDVVLAEIGDRKIHVIKAVREITGLGLKEAKEVVDKAPGPIKEGASNEEAEQIKEKLEEQGATVELK